MSDDFARRKFEWLGRVEADSALPAYHVRIALRLSGYFNRETGEAWPSQETLARGDLRAVRGVQKALKSLIANGHLEVIADTKLRRTNRYKMAIKDTNSGSANGYSPRTAIPNDTNSRSEGHEQRFVQNNRRNNLRNKGGHLVEISSKGIPDGEEVVLDENGKRLADEIISAFGEFKFLRRHLERLIALTKIEERDRLRDIEKLVLRKACHALSAGKTLDQTVLTTVIATASSEHHARLGFPATLRNAQAGRIVHLATPPPKAA